MYIPNNATSISFAIPRVTILISNSRTIVPTNPANEAATPATTLSARFLDMGYANVVTVTACGRTSMHRKRINVSHVLAGQRVGI
jgi:hypothetical protein